MPDSLRITEIFYSLQGEAANTGKPTVFVRLTGCPLRCSYCDTAYAFSGGEIMPLPAVVSRIGDWPCRLVTITGGEPLAQAESLVLMQQLCDLGYRVSLETSGALDVAGVDARVAKVLDLKTPGSGELSRNLYSNIDLLGHRDQVKFVICNRQDYEWARLTIDRYHLQDIGCELLFSTSHGQLPEQELAAWILADNLDVRLQIQLHKFLWGDKPGV